MQEEEVEMNQIPFYKRYLILRIPVYIVIVLYCFTLSPLINLFWKNYGIIRKRVLRYRVKRLGNNMSVAFNEDRYEDAKNLCLRIIEIIPPVWRHLYEGYRFAILSLGSIYRFLGNLKEAERYILEANEILEERDFYRVILVIYEGDVHADKGEFKGAEECYLAAYELLKYDKESEYYETVCFNLHGLYMEMGQIEKAEKFLKESEA